MKNHFDTEGPFGLPMKDRQAKALERIVRELPKDDAFTPRRIVATKGVSELLPDTRSDVSWITAEVPDLAGDLVLATGMDDSHFQLNPIVTLNHSYDTPPVGRSLWRRKIVAQGAVSGVKAKTFYPQRPASWTMSDWPPDQAFDLIKAGLLGGKSIGFLPLQLRSPTPEEVQQTPQLESVRHVITRWLLLEYACCYLPMQPLAVVEEVSKSLPDDVCRILQIPRPDRTPAFTRLSVLREALAARVWSEEFEKIFEESFERTLQNHLDPW